LLGRILQNLKQAPVYSSKAVGYTDQPDFLNTAVRGQTDLEPEALLARIKNIERQVGRTPTFHHGPREIDIDIIFYGERVIENPRLTIPHPAFKERDFVLQPLSDLDPSLADPVTKQSVGSLLANIPGGQKSLIERVDEKP
jgi:2-amino-4-hydroxy-6-hydroxymethyldihydropteridine diphosphokinase